VLILRDGPEKAAVEVLVHTLGGISGRLVAEVLVY
jgi:hypothetical protein